MQVREIMSTNCACCVPETNLQNVAQLMFDHDCGAIPVVNNENELKPVGIVTDRDIACRVVAKGENPMNKTAADCMTSQVIHIAPECSIEECCDTMQKNQVRRLVVADENGCCCGIVSQADIAERCEPVQCGEVVKEVSRKQVPIHA